MKKYRVSIAAFFAVLPFLVTQMGVAATLPTSWHLDRINQTALPLDGNVSMGALTGAGVNIYVVDTGVLASHEQFGGRVIAGIDIPTQDGSAVIDPIASDCDGHGTHVAGLAAGSTVGVATQATVIAVRVLDCEGDGDVADVVKALQWVRAHHRSGVAAVLNLSLGVDLGDDGTAIDHEVKSLLDEGVVVVVAAGNGNAGGMPYDACEIAPADVPRALTVGATGITDVVATYSNYGSCVDLYAPGGDRIRSITSAWNTSSSSYDTDAGTSMASPLVAGFAAQLAQQQPGLCADSISQAIVERSTQGVLVGVPLNSPNKLLMLNTSPVVTTTPGIASNVITVTDNKSLSVSWDAPCNGGLPITRTVVSLLLNGQVVQRVVAGAGTSSVRFSKLTNGRTYQVVIKAENELGVGIATSRISTVAVRAVRVGSTIRTVNIAKGPEDISLKLTVSSSSKKYCALKTSPSRLVSLRAGTCRIALRQLEGQVPVLRSILITR